jgi:hypothetical protein
MRLRIAAVQLGNIDGKRHAAAMRSSLGEKATSWRLLSG